jgi:hypothetical protein
MTDLSEKHNPHEFPVRVFGVFRGLQISLRLFSFCRAFVPLGVLGVFRG